MAEENRCPNCGSTLPANAPHGVCPKCLMKAGLLSASDVTLDISPVREGPGTKIGHYELLELIGEGGMGIVYLAEQKEPVRRKVVLKIVKPGMDSKQVIARFEAERQVLAILDHPNIAHVFDAGTTETVRPYFVMEYVKGMSITRYCDENKLSIEKRLRLFEQVCEGIHHAHQKGIIHRDIKPSNILVSVHDDKAFPKIIDFGIAKAITQPLTDKTFVTFRGQLLGTPEYMSPEQVDLATQDIDIRSDIYSLGVVLYELLTGVLPFEEETFGSRGFADIQRTIRELEPVLPSMRLTNLGEKAKAIAASRGTQVVPLARRLHRELEWIPLKAMRKDRCRRYKSASDMAEDIRNYLNGNPLIAGPETTVYRVKKFVHKHTGSVVTIALVAAVIVTGFFVSTAMYFRAEDARRKEVAARTEAEATREKETAARIQAQEAEKIAQEQRALAEKAEEATKQKAEELRHSHYVNDIQLADIKYNEHNMSRVRELLELCPDDLRNWEWDRLNYLSDQSLMTLRGHKGWVDCVAISPDGKRIASGGQTDHAIKIWDRETGKELINIPEAHLDIIRCVSFSPDGKRLISGSADKTVKVRDVQNRSEILNLEALETVWDARFSPNGKVIAYVGGAYERMNGITVCDAITGEILKILSGHTDEIRSLAFSPDSKKIITGSTDGTIKIWDIGTGIESTTIHGHKEGILAISLSRPDGKRIISSGRDNVIKVWDTGTGKELLSIPEAHNGLGFIYSVAFSPDNRYICSGGWDQTIKMWDAATGENVLNFRGHDGWILSIEFSLDGRQIVSSGGGDGTIKVWDVTENHEITKLSGHHSSISSIAFSQDGERLVSGSQNGMVKLWNMMTCSEFMTLRSRQEENSIYSVAFSPDGRYVAAGGVAQTFQIWDTNSGAETIGFHGHEDAVETVAFSPDGKYIASGGKDKTVRVWEVDTGKELTALKGHESGVICVAFSPDGKFIASGSSDPNIRIWEWQTGREHLILRGHSHGIILSVAFSPDGKRIVSACQNDYTVKEWDAITGAELTTLKHADVVISASFSPDGKRIVSGCRDNTARVWDSTTGVELLKLQAESGVTASTFSPSNKTIAAGTFDGQILLWESSAPTNIFERWNGKTAKEVVEELYSKLGYYSRVIEELHTETNLDEAVRYLALQIANSRRCDDAEKLVDELYKQYGSYDNVIDNLQTNSTFDEPTRKLALEIADSRKGIEINRLAKEMANEIFQMIVSPDRDPNIYQAIVEKAEKAYRTEPNDLGLLVSLGMTQCIAGQYENAIVTLTKAHSLEPNTPAILGPLSDALYHEGRYKDAVKTLTMELEIDRRVLGEESDLTMSTLNQLAWIQATCPEAKVRDGAEAVKNATRVCEFTNWKNWGYLDTLAAAYAEIGDYNSAVKWQKEAIELLPKRLSSTIVNLFTGTSNKTEFEERLKLYESGKPYRK
ncbi:MAG: protein kinase [Sedimentisphaerales bacterium]|nr:protein kinase [Sedimentisphaerales bacterium]